MALPFDIVVTTCKDYAGVTLPRFFDSFRQAGLPMQSVRVVVGQCGPPAHDAAPDEVLLSLEAAGATVVRVPYGAEALTGVVACANLDIVQTPWFLSVQDTCLVGPDMGPRAMRVWEGVRDAHVDVVRLLDKFALSVGMYRTAWVKDHAQRLNEHRIFEFDVHAVRKLKMHIEDKAFDMADPARTVVLGSFDNPDDRKVVGQVQYPGSRTQRIVEHYPSLDLYKLKSWFGQGVRVYNTPHGELLEIPVGV